MIDYKRAFGDAIDTLVYICNDCCVEMINCPLRNTFCCQSIGCRDDWENYILSKQKIKLTRFEYDFLKNLNDEWHYIARTRFGNIIIFAKKPKKYEDIWIDETNMSTFDKGIFNHDFFKFITWEDEETYNIQELLENCEVLQDE